MTYAVRQEVLYKGALQNERGEVVGFNPAGDVIVCWEDGCQTAHAQDDPRLQPLGG